MDRPNPAHNRLALSVSIALAAFAGYGRQAYAACTNTGGSTYLCENASGPQGINADNADVSTAPGFGATAGASDAIEITGDGALRYTDLYQSALSSDEDGLHITANGDAGDTPGSIAINTGGDITGRNHGIRADNHGSGAMTVTVTAGGEVTGTQLNGLAAPTISAGRSRSAASHATGESMSQRSAWMLWTEEPSDSSAVGGSRFLLLLPPLPRFASRNDRREFQRAGAGRGRVTEIRPGVRSSAMQWTRLLA